MLALAGPEEEIEKIRAEKAERDESALFPTADDD
jgi:hypothetical protein